LTPVTPGLGNLLARRNIFEPAQKPKKSLKGEQAQKPNKTVSKL